MKQAIRIVALLAMTAQIWARSELKDGDLIFQSSNSAQSVAIERATHSPYSHVGIIFHRSGRAFVLEAVQPVKYTSLKAWMARGRKGAYVVKRLKEPLSSGAAQGIRKAGEKFLGKDYDYPFGWSDDKLYCSELVWKAYDRGAGVKLCKLRRLKDFDLKDPLVAAKLKERYGVQVPLEEPVVSPADLFDSDLLTRVEEKDR